MNKKRGVYTGTACTRSRDRQYSGHAQRVRALSYCHRTAEHNNIITYTTIEISSYKIIIDNLMHNESYHV